MNGWPTQEQTLLLKACLLSGKNAQEAWENWTHRVDFDKVEPGSFRLLPLIYRNPSLAGIQDPLLKKCEGIYRQTWTSNQMTWKSALPLFTQFLNAGIEKIVVLKGFAMILHYYRDFGVRTVGDVDIFIDKTHLQTARSLLCRSQWRQYGTRFDLNNPEHLARWHALSFLSPQGTDLDLHWSFIQEHSPILDAAVLKDALIKDLPLYVPNPTDLLLQTCVHGVKYSPIPLVRWVADAMTILKEHPIDWERLTDLAKVSRVTLPLGLALEYLATHFTAPIPEQIVRALRSQPIHRLELSEYRFNSRGHLERAAWCRYCLIRGYLTRLSQILHVHKYLQCTARLKSVWQMPFYAVYWVFKRLFRSLKTTAGFGT